MRFQARLVLGLFGLALFVPGWVAAAPPGDEAPADAQVSTQPPPHQHKGLFGRRHCTLCQLATAKSKYGIDVPPPPSLGPVAGMQGEVTHMPGHVTHAPGANCATCQGEVIMEGPATVVDHSAPGYAVVGGSGGVPSPNAPGYAVVGGGGAVGADPAPIGVATNRKVPGGFDPRMAAAGGASRPGASPYDPAVVPTNLPPGQVALSGPGHERPHIISHLLGLPKLGKLHRDQEDKERQKHAAIAYDESKSPVSELPASMVYGKGGH